jgi:hypothetical protein
VRLHGRTDSGNSAQRGMAGLGEGIWRASQRPRARHRILDGRQHDLSGSVQDSCKAFVYNNSSHATYRLTKLRLRRTSSRDGLRPAACSVMPTEHTTPAHRPCCISPPGSRAAWRKVPSLKHFRSRRTFIDAELTPATTAAKAQWTAGKRALAPCSLARLRLR